MESEDLRRLSFEANARAYEAERPGYPEPLFDHLVELSKQGARVLEIACGTGKATRSLLARGMRVTAIELGASLAAIARDAFVDQPFEVHVGRFEEWEPPPTSFDLAVCAQAYHWLDPEIAGPKIARALAPGAHLACFWNAEVHRVPWLDAIYDEHAPELEFTGTFPMIEDRLAQQRAWIERGGALETIDARAFPWTMRKAADAYVRLIDTYSEQGTLPPQTKARLYPAIRAAIEARGGTIEREMNAYLIVARPRRA